MVVETESPQLVLGLGAAAARGRAEALTKGRPLQRDCL